MTLFTPDELIPERELSFRRQESRYLKARLVALQRADDDDRDVLGLRHTELADRLAAAQTRERELNQCLAETRAELQPLRRRLEELLEANRKAADDVGELAEIRARLARIDPDLEAAKGEAERASKQVDVIGRQLAAAVTEREAATADADRLRRQLAEAEATVARLAEADRQLTRLLQKFARTPLVVVFRRWPGYRRLEQEWTDRR